MPARIVLNRNQMRKAREALKALPPKRREGTLLFDNNKQGCLFYCGRAVPSYMNVIGIGPPM
jgi:hypothetical protein